MIKRKNTESTLAPREGDLNFFQPFFLEISENLRTPESTLAPLPMFLYRALTVLYSFILYSIILYSNEINPLKHPLKFHYTSPWAT